MPAAPAVSLMVGRSSTLPTAFWATACAGGGEGLLDDLARSRSRRAAARCCPTRRGAVPSSRPVTPPTTSPTRPPTAPPVFWSVEPSWSHDLRVVVDEGERVVHDVIDVVEVHEQQRLRAHAANREVHVADEDVGAGAQSHEVRDPRVEVDLRRDGIDLQVDVLDAEVRDVEHHVVFRILVRALGAAGDRRGALRAARRPATRCSSCRPRRVGSAATYPRPIRMRARSGRRGQAWPPCPTDCRHRPVPVRRARRTRRRSRRAARDCGCA